MAAGDTTPGRRLDDLSDVLKPGDYWMGPTNVVGETFRELWCRLPVPYGTPGSGLRRLTDEPGRWTFTENEDGSVTVGGSVLAKLPDGNGGWRDGWHGYLEHGIWREV